MPKRKDIKKVLIIGSGPIIIGQACEFDYSGSQACRALKREGIEVVLINNNPATIMTDPEIADRIYLEPLTVEFVTKICKKERPDAILTTMGGQTGLNLTLRLHELGVLKELSIEPIGAGIEPIRLAEDRRLFKERMEQIGLELPRSGYVKNLREAKEVSQKLGFPLIIRPSFTLGGSGGSICYDEEEYLKKVAYGISISPIHTVLVEEFLEGWKEFELELMRDRMDNCVVIASIENVDPMGVHTGDSITVAPQQTLSDYEYQRMRTAAINVIRAVGVDTGGSNIQFAIDPKTGAMKVIEMNPRVSRSSALASKATGFPIAKIAALLAIGYTLDEIRNDITKKTPASFEPALDYCVVKFPRWNFEKFPQASRTIGSQMQSVGEAMAIGRNFKEALQKAIYSLESNHAIRMWQAGFEEFTLKEVKEGLRPNPDRIFFVRLAIGKGIPIREINRRTGIDPWFLNQIKEIVEIEKALPSETRLITTARRIGFSDSHLIRILKIDLPPRRTTYKAVDTCAGEFEAQTPYFYSTHEDEDEASPLEGKKVVIVGSGPNRIGQGIEFDYCCVHTALALRRMGIRVIMVNSNPETVSTDYDISDRLYFEPLDYEHIIDILTHEQPDGIILQMGGQTPLKLARAVAAQGFKILGTGPEVIELCEDREKFSRFLEDNRITFPAYGTARSEREAIAVAQELGFPLLIRPSFVLGGRAMGIVYNEADLRELLQRALRVSEEHPILIDRFLEDAFEYDLDGVSDGEEILIGGVMEQIEEAGIHSGDSACSYPPCMGRRGWFLAMEHIAKRIALGLGVIGLFNIQFAVKEDQIYVLEVNPRASRTVPYLSKSTGVPLIEIATKVIMGARLKDLKIPRPRRGRFAIKQPVFSFEKFDRADPKLGPEMKSTGEVVGIGRSFGESFAKSFLGVFHRIPTKGRVLITVNDSDKPKVVPIAWELRELGFQLIATEGTGRYLRENHLEVETVKKIHEGSPNPLQLIEERKIDLLINTPLGRNAQYDDYLIRRKALENRIPYTTTISAARCLIEAIRTLKGRDLRVIPLH
ncbi:carbamoyl phosphate synthase large subunit [candidate division WOR-3 bacterium]|uniref:Carbamoyl phosphate synthase large chain n=1 Tax=candidate division WOR-3 bacterium TaxID=2052148 RepID=A0A660SLM8_UNCW3|nr:MAG: carbamoyl phosphate synthase large subunit [candidate division WOR-3 bacterium]